MPSLTLQRRAAPVLALLCGLAVTTAVRAAPFMIVGDDEKPGTDAQGKPMVNPTGNDAVLIVDLANPEAPKIVASLPLENSIVGPPTNLAISPTGAIALVADSMTVAEDKSERQIRRAEPSYAGKHVRCLPLHDVQRLDARKNLVDVDLGGESFDQNQPQHRSQNQNADQNHLSNSRW